MPLVSFAVEMTTSEGGGVNLVPEPRTTTDRLSLFAVCSAAATPAASTGSKICGGISSEPLRQPGTLGWMLPIGAGHFAAQPGSREDLAGVADSRRIESASHELHRVEIRLGEHLRHVALLVHADAVFA